MCVVPALPGHPRPTSAARPPRLPSTRPGSWTSTPRSCDAVLPRPCAHALPQAQPVEASREGMRLPWWCVHQIPPPRYLHPPTTPFGPARSIPAQRVLSLGGTKCETGSDGGFGLVVSPATVSPEPELCAKSPLTLPTSFASSVLPPSVQRRLGSFLLLALSCLHHT